MKPWKDPFQESFGHRFCCYSCRRHFAASVPTPSAASHISVLPPIPPPPHGPWCEGIQVKVNTGPVSSSTDRCTNPACAYVTTWMQSQVVAPYFQEETAVPVNLQDLQQLPYKRRRIESPTRSVRLKKISVECSSKDC